LSPRGRLAHLIFVSIFKENVKQADTLSKEFLDHVRLLIPWLGNALPLPE